MRITSLTLSLAILAPLAHADMIKRATLWLECTSTKFQDRIELQSSRAGSILSINGNDVFSTAQQATAGTEGGPAYLQMVGASYSVTLSGPAFNKAFMEGKAMNVTVTGSILSLRGNHAALRAPAPITCKGNLAFE